MEFKVGDIVARKSYNYDVLFRIIHINNEGIADLVGITTRILADSYLYDLKIISNEEFMEYKHHETELNLLILEINQELKKITKKDKCGL